MTDRLDLGGFDRDVDAFSLRAGATRGTPEEPDGGAPGPDGRRTRLRRVIPGDGRRVRPRDDAAGGQGTEAALEAALHELEIAEEELRVARDELLAQRDRSGEPAAERERKLLRAVLGELPVPVFLLERDGIVRRANRAACALVDAPAAYPVGKPFTSFMSQRDRGALRFAVSAAAAGSRGAPVRGAVLAKGRPRDVVLRLAPLRLPGEVDPLVAIVAIAVGPGSPPGADRAAAALAGLDGTDSSDGADSSDNTDNTDSAGPPAGDRPDAPAGARRLDAMASMTRLLLDPAVASEGDLLHRAAELLVAELADAVLVDLDDGTGTLVRRVVAGPASSPATGVAVPRRTLPGRVAAGGRPELLARVEHPADLGTLSGGAGAVPGATSAAAAPLLPPGSEGPVHGVVTLVRRDGTAYDLAELGLLQQLCEHLALALRAGRAARRRTEVADALRAGLLPRRLPEPDGLRIAAAFRPGDPPEALAGPAVGGDFYDAVPSGDGWAVLLGDVNGGDQEAASFAATVRHSLGALAHAGRRPEDVLARSNAYLRDLGGDRFATAAIARLTRRRGGWRAMLAGAGNPPALVVPADGPVTAVPVGGRPLGLFDDARPVPVPLELGPGDMLLLHSDGVTGATSPQGAPFGDEALVAVATRTRDGAHQLVDAVRDAVVRHAGGRLRDDVSLLAVRVAD